MREHYRGYFARVMSQSMVLLAHSRDPFVQNHAAFGWIGSGMVGYIATSLGHIILGGISLL